MRGNLLTADAALKLPWYTRLMQDPQHDVAISFLSKDEPLALQLHEQLSENLSVFVYSKKQEELAGTDGLESFRLAFFSQSRLVVVLYREAWGKTRWTGIEELAIRDRMFKGGWESLLFVTMDGTYPTWLPETRVRLDYTKYAHTLVGAIKLRAQELGSELRVETAVGRAKRMNLVALAQAERRQKLGYEARGAVSLEWANLCRLVEEKITEIRQIGPQLGLEFSKDEFGFALRTTQASIRFALPQAFSSSSERRIVFQTFPGPVFLRQEFPLGRMYIPGNEPQKTSESTFDFDYDAAYEWCWRDAKGELLTTDSLSELFMKTLLEAHQKVEAGEIPRRKSASRTRGTAWS